jgi:hypothetical protein
MASALAFAPLPAALGGLTLGVLTVSRLVLSGRVLGISGDIKGVVTLQPDPWRFLFLAGLLGGGAALAVLYPAALAPLPAAYSFGRALASGALVGVGTRLSEGCTSGHGERRGSGGSVHPPLPAACA